MSGINFSYIPSTTLKYKSLTDGYKGLNNFGSSSSSGTSFSLGNSSGTSSASGALSGLGWSALRTVGNNIVGGAVNQTYKNLDSPYAQQVKDLFDATQDPIARAVKNWTGKGRDNILKAIHNDTPNEDLFKFNIVGSDNASLLNNFGYDRHSDEELGIRQNIRKKNFWQAFGDFNNQAGVGATYGAEMGGWIGALAGLALGATAGGINWAYDNANTTTFNNAINQNNMLKRMREQSYQDDYLAQYSNQVNDVANMNYRSNLRNYYGILKDGGSIHIKPENRGKFTALKERTGHSATWFKEKGTPAQKKMATFALNAAKWHHKAEGGQLPLPDDWKALRNIRYNVYPDTTFTKNKTGYGSIEVFDKNNGDTIRYPNGYTIVNPYPKQNTIYYNPNLNDEQDIKLDALHLMPQDATYDALYTEYMNAINSGDVYFNAKNRYNDDVKRYGKNNIDSFDQYLRNEADGLLRNMFIEGTPEYMKSKNYYPDKKQLAQWNENLMPYINNIHNYLVTGERPKNVLPEVVIKPTDYRNGGEIGTMDDINNGFIDITEGGTHEQNPLGGVPVNIAEDGLPNLVEEGEMIYNGYVYSNNLRPSEETKKRLGLKGSTYADVIRKAQKYSSERPDDPVSKEYDKYIATTLAVNQEQQKINQDMTKTNKKGIRGHYAKLGDWLGENAYKGMYTPVIGAAGQYLSDLFGNTNQYDYSEIDDFRRNAGDLQTPTLVGYNDVGQKIRYNPMDSDYMMNKAANQIAANRSMLRYASPTAAALQRNLMGLNYTGITSLADALLKNQEYNDNLKKGVIGFNNAVDLENAKNRFTAAQTNAQAINRYKEALADRNLKLAATQAEMRSNIDTAISNARNINRDTFLGNTGDAGKQFAIFRMIQNDPSLLYSWLNNFDVEYKGGKSTKNGGWLRCGGSIRSKRRK